MKKRPKSTKALLVVIGLGICVSLIGCGAGEREAERQAALAAEGARHYAKTCATCHGQDAKGLPNLGKGLLANQFVADKTDVELVEFLSQGRLASHPLNTTGVAMPPKGGNPALTVDDLEQIVAYLRTL